MTEHRFTARDDRFHFAEMGDDWWATETAWFSFHHPERRLGGWFYTMVRPNIGTVAGGAWVWDDSAYLPWDVLYSANYSALELPRDQDLDDCRLPTGVAIKVLEPCHRYALGYDDGDRLQADLRFEGVMRPEPLTAVGSTFGSAHHFDQFGRVSGELILHGERLPIDCIGMRDRTWGARPENRARQAAYVTGAAGPDHGFLAVTNAREIEELLFAHPKVQSVACVAMPDPVLVERVCAFVICPPGDPLTFDEMIAFLKAQRMAVWKLPERLEVRAAFPMTPSGKIQKYLLREEIAGLLGRKALIR